MKVALPRKLSKMLPGSAEVGLLMNSAMRRQPCAGRKLSSV
jgi:hypothetical protein